MKYPKGSMWELGKRIVVIENVSHCMAYIHDLGTTEYETVPLTMLSIEINGKTHLEVMMDEVLKKINLLRYKVWLRDISNPTVPEYMELHEKIQKTLKELDELIKWIESEVIR